ncbi:AAA family ATPase [Paraburkholderia lacunae]|uniref:Pilus assembly protein CpaE n=1 Tax=Paraburkholderia lacunae TaxID=2211104 RepID=A0A370NCQ2_9BURK|nr:AAA family ATPase [Paraburkholderia lacunae]RDK03364.1 pilus assembly protein CpaE [Paraburkholderia lacunae]
MIDILLISSSAERASRICAQLEDSGIAYRLRTVHGTARQLRVYATAIRHTDVLIVDDIDLSAHDLVGIEEALACTPNLSCMLVTPAPSAALLTAAARIGVRHVMSLPLDPSGFPDALDPVDAKNSAGARRLGRVVSLASCKGGSGATLIAVNLAYTLAALRGKRVLLLDLNQQFADISLLVADKPPPVTVADLCAQIDRLGPAFLETCVMHVHADLDVLAGAGDPLRAAEMRPAQLKRILSLGCEQYDAVLIDIGQSINPLAVQALDHSDSICMVVRQDTSYLYAGRRMLDIFKGLGYPANKIRVVVNQYDKNARINLPTLEETLGAKVAHQLPRDEMHVNEALEHGVPLVTSAGDSTLAQGIGLLTDMLWPAIAESRKGVPGRLFSTRPNAPPQLKTGH